MSDAQNEILEEDEGPDNGTILRMILSLVMTLVIVVSGVLWTWQIGKCNNALYHKLSHAREEVSGLRESAGGLRPQTPHQEARL